jgi:hypothetical protein
MTYKGLTCCEDRPSDGWEWVCIQSQQGLNCVAPIVHPLQPIPATVQNERHKDDLMRNYLRQWGIEVPFRDGGRPAHIYCGVSDFSG